jgi:hypothetical protein
VFATEAWDKGEPEKLDPPEILGEFRYASEILGEFRTSRTPGEFCVEFQQWPY